jgi:hypothetical protein
MKRRESMISRVLPKMSGEQRKYEQSWVTEDEWRAKKV